MLFAQLLVSVPQLIVTVVGELPVVERFPLSVANVVPNPVTPEPLSTPGVPPPEPVPIKMPGPIVMPGPTAIPGNAMIYFPLYSVSCSSDGEVLIQL